MRESTTLLIAAVVAIPLLAAGQGQAEVPPAPGTTPVSVQAGQTTTGIDAALADGAGVNGEFSGRLVDRASADGLNGRSLWVFSSSGHDVNRVFSAADGTFVLHVPPSSDGYVICVSDPFRRYAKPTYVSECLPGERWDGIVRHADLPDGVERIPLAPGEHKNLGAVRLTAGAKITGVGRDESGHRLNVSRVYARSVSNPAVTAWGFSRGRAYVLDGLPPSPKGWRVCIDGGRAFPPHRLTPALGYVSACYGGATWTGGRLPAGATPVRATPDDPARGIDVVLPTGGGIAGRVTGKANDDRLSDIAVSVFDSHGHEVSSGATDARGRFEVTGLPSRDDYRVCTEPEPSAEKVRSYFGKCYHGGDWQVGNHPSGASVPARRGEITLGVHLELERAATVEGKIVRADGKPDDFASVYLFDRDGAQLGRVETIDLRGRYRFTGLRPPREGYYVCAVDGLGDDAELNKSGSAPVCYGGAAWSGGEAPLPSEATAIHPVAHQVLAGVSIVLAQGGSIGGTVSSGSTGDPLDDNVYVYDAEGNLIAHTSSNGGDYQLDGLAPADGYQVCFAGAGAAPPRGRYHYLGQCYADVDWQR